MRNFLYLLLITIFFHSSVEAQTITTKESRCVNTGEISFAGTIGAGGPYQFTVSEYPPAYTPGGIQPVNSLPFTFNGLFPGSYTIAARDRQGTIFNFSAIQVAGNYVLPGNNDYRPLATGVTSCLSPNGVLQGVMTNGRPPYTYTIISGPAHSGITNSSGTFTGLAAGNYRLQAADSCQNIQTRDVVVTDSISSLVLSRVVINRIGCNQFSLDSAFVLPLFPPQGHYEIINYNGSGNPVTRATGNTLPMSFSVFALTDIPNGRVRIFVYDSCGNRASFTPTEYENDARDTIANGVINRIGCNRYSLDALSMSPPLPAGAIVQLTNTTTGIVYSSPLPLQFTAAPGDISTGRIAISVTDSCGTITTSAQIRNINNPWNFAPIFKIYCSSVVIESLSFSGFVVNPYTVSVKALFTDSTGSIDSTSEQMIASFPYTVSGIAGSPNPLTIRIEVRDSCGELRRVTLSQSFVMSAGVMKPLSCGVTSIDLSVFGRFVLPVTYSVSPDPGAGTNTTGRFELPEGVYLFTARDSCGKQTSVGPLDFRRNWRTTVRQHKGCSEEFITNSIAVPARSSGIITVKQYEGRPPVTGVSPLISTKTFASQLNYCVGCADSSTTREVINFDNTLPGQAYTYILSDSCGRADTVTIVNDSTLLQFHHRAFSRTKCVSGSNIYANWQSNGDSVVRIRVFNASNNTLVNFNSGLVSNLNAYPNGQLVLSDAPRGTYIIKYQLGSCTREYVDTVITKEYVQPAVTVAQTFLPCAGGSPVIIAGAQGIAPYQYEIVNSFPDHLTAPPQSNPVFTFPVSQTTITVRITDACLNSSTRTIAVTTAQPPVIRSTPALLSACTLPFTFSLQTDSLYAGSVFEWRKLSGTGAGQSVIGNSTSLPVTYNFTGDTATYQLIVTVPNTCFSVVSYFTINDIPVTCAAGITGNVLNDANGLSDALVNGRGTNAGGLYAVLVNSSNTVTAVSPVTNHGTYGFANLSQGSYSILLSVSAATLNAPPPPASLPPGWVNTGEHTAATPGNDGTVNGRLSGIAIDSAIVSELNFGIEQLPVAYDTVEPGTNPGGNLRIPVPFMTGSDAEDGIYDGVSGINTVVIHTLPTNAVLYYNGIAVITGQMITNYNPVLLTIDPNDNIASTSFTFSEVDAAMQQSIPATVIIIFYGLPVHIVSFTAAPQLGKVVLDWQVGEQLGILRYTIEFSTDGTNFSPAGSITAGNQQLYRFTHLSPVNGTNFYRLKIWEHDGSFSYSKIATAKFSVSQFLQVLPNPFLNHISLIAHLMKPSAVRIIIYDAFGRKVHGDGFDGRAGSNYFVIDNLGKLSKGIYTISVFADGFIYSSKILK